MSTAPKIEQYPCVMHERTAGACGDTWYQFVTEQHTVGACCKFDLRSGVPIKFTRQDLPLSAKKIAKDGTLHLSLVTAQGEVVTSLAIGNA